MKAILLSAGLGSRLRPITNKIPKCLVPINGKPILDIWLRNLQKCGVSEFLVNTHYLSESVIEFVEKHPLRDKIKLCHEDSLLGTAGTLVKNIDFFQGDDGMLIHVDNYVREDLARFVDEHESRPSKCLVTMMCFETRMPESCGIIEINNDGIVIKFHEKVKNPPGNLANGAVYVITAKAIAFIKQISQSVALRDFSVDVIPHFLGKIYSYQTYEPFVDIGTPETYRLAGDIDKELNTIT